MVKAFEKLLSDAFGEGSSQAVYGDFKPIGEVTNPGFYIHVVKKPS